MRNSGEDIGILLPFKIKPDSVSGFFYFKELIHPCNHFRLNQVRYSGILLFIFNNEKYEKHKNENCFAIFCTSEM